MANMTALINKATLKMICDAKSVETSYIADKINCKPSTKIDDWINVASQSLPTFNQAKAIAKCLKIPFAGLYMNPQDVTIKSIPKLTNRRTFPDGFMGNDSALNIAISDLITFRDFFIETKNELKETISSLSISITDNQDAIKLAAEIRAIFNIDLGEQYELPSTRQFYLYVRRKVEEKGVFIHSFSGVDLEVVRGIAIYDDIMPIIGINEKDRYPAMTFSIIHELIDTLIREHLIVTCSEIADEIKDDDLAEWFKNLNPVILPVDEDIQKNVVQVVTTQPKLVDFKQIKSSGDAFLIATAMKHNLIIITEESKESPKKIPKVAESLGIETVNIIELCEKEGKQF